jgi:hypothetical protein
MLIIRQLGLVMLACAAVAVFFFMTPEVPDDEAGEAIVDALELAEEFYDLNNDAAESAPQQQVVNGWYVNDLLNIIALETGRTATQSSDDRTAALLAIGVVAIALWGVTAPPAGQASALTVPLPEPAANKANPAADFQSSSTSQDTN